MILRYLKKCFHYTFQTTLLEAPCLMWVCYYQSAEKYFLQMNYNIFTALLVILGIIIDLYSLLALCRMQEFHNESEINKSFCSCCLSVFSFSGAFLKCHAFAEYHVWTVFDGGHLKRHIVAIKTLHCDVKGFIEWMKKKLRFGSQGNY